MYPGTIFNWHDQSVIENVPINTVDNSPLFFTVSSFDRGPEDLRVVNGQDFYKLYGSKMNFTKHGQPALQAANMINGGARLLIKRLVAKDATLANTIAVSKLTSTVKAIKANVEDPNGKTLVELMGGEATTVVYTEALEILSSVGSEDGHTVLDVTPELEAGNSYFYKVTESDVALTMDYAIDSSWISWDGVSELNVADGTKIMLVEADARKCAKKCAVITVTSKIGNPPTTSTVPTNGLNALYITSKEGETEGFTNLIITPAILHGNKYFYKVLPKDTIVNFPSVGVDYTVAEMSDWREWDGLSEIEASDEEIILLCEFSSTEDETGTFVYNAIKGASVEANVNKGDDTRTSESVELIIPAEDKYIIDSQANTVTWMAKSISNCKTIEDVYIKAENMKRIIEPVVSDNGDGTISIESVVEFPMFVVVDNGRGTSSKSIKFVPDYTSSKDSSEMFYTATVFDGTTNLESVICSMNPTCIFAGSLYGINEDISGQVIIRPVTGMYDQYVDAISKITGYSKEALNAYDLMFMTNSRGSSLSPYITLNEDSIDFASAFGVELLGGSNGNFGDAPFGTEAWIQEAVEVITGQFDNVIWDVDTYKIAAIFDANYPLEVKNAFAKFVNFREDCMFFRDYGLDCNSYAAIKAYYDSIDNEYKSKFVPDYYTTYQIYDPETKVRIRVTMMYDFARAMIGLFASGCYRPAAGIINNMVLDNAIEGTINFTPRITPDVNQKALLDDMRLNYAIFEQGRCIVQSLYTSQPKFTQLSFLNNVLAIQEVCRSVRIACPKQRYTFVTNSDFSSYAEAVNNVLKGFKSNFAELKFEYQQNNLKAAQKIFYASIYFRFNNWAQTEVFDIFALPNE